MSQKHPHARGEDLLSVRACRGTKETPPRTWGRRRRAPGRGRTCRNTPTHVGKTIRRPHRTPWGQKHPHARGEDLLSVRACRGTKETPPRTWGRRRRAPGRGRTCRNTPTHVGKTIRRPHRTPWGQKHPHARGEDVHQLSLGMGAPETPPRTWGRPALC